MAEKKILLLTFLTILLSFGTVRADSVQCLLADGFDYPVGKPDAAGYYKARGFWPNGHLGEDWNGNGGGDSDLNDPIYSMGHGVVVLSEDVKVGWGNCVIIRHVFRAPTGRIEMVDSLYGHLQERRVRVGQHVRRGELVGTMGGNNGMYPVHLHFEVRKNLAIGMNRSKFARDYSNYYSPTHFIVANRNLVSEARKYAVPVNTFAAYGGELSGDQRTFDVPDPAASAPAGGVRRSRGGLSIPVVNGPTGGGYSPGQVAPPATPGTPRPPAPPSPTSTDKDKSDFWNRLKSKLGNGEVTGGDGPK